MTQAEFTGRKRKPGEGKPNRTVVAVPAAVLGLVMALFLVVSAAQETSPLPDTHTTGSNAASLR